MAGTLIPNQSVRFALDAMLNLFDIQFVDAAAKLAAMIPSGFVFNEDDFRFRIQDATTPDLSLNTYQVDFLTRTYDKPSSKITTTNELTFNFRVDKNFKFYQFLVNWFNSVHNMGSGMVSTLEGKVCQVKLAPVTTLPGSAAGEGTAEPSINGWIFNECFPKNIGGINFAHNAGDPVVIPVTLGFMYMDLDVSQPVGTTAGAGQDTTAGH